METTTANCESLVVSGNSSNNGNGNNNNTNNSNNNNNTNDTTANNTNNNNSNINGAMLGAPTIEANTPGGHMASLGSDTANLDIVPSANNNNSNNTANNNNTNNSNNVDVVTANVLDAGESLLNSHKASLRPTQLQAAVAGRLPLPNTGFNASMYSTMTQPIASMAENYK